MGIFMLRSRGAIISEQMIDIIQDRDESKVEFYYWPAEEDAARDQIFVSLNAGQN